MRHPIVRLAGLLSFIALTFPGRPSGAWPQSGPTPSPDALLVVMTETGETRAGLPVLAPHPDSAAVAGVLLHGFCGRWIRLYRDEQHYLAATRGGAPGPAYVLLSSRQGGFAETGFWLGGAEKRDTGYVDVYRSHPLVGRFAALDQIVPHELAHVMVEQLTGPIGQGGSNQVHALGVRTDPVVAFNEGLAESLQVMALEDPDADPATRALAGDGRLRELAERQIAQYGRELQTAWRPPGRRRLTFPLWYSGAEQVLRYHAVKANAFLREPPLPDALLAPARVYDAYLIAATEPGSDIGRVKTAGVLLSTEAVVSHLFYRWATDPEIGGRYEAADFYARFGVEPGQVAPVENAYLKLLHVLAARRPLETASLVRAYVAEFPSDAPAVERVVRRALGGQWLPDAPPIWLANADFVTGTSLFDQYRANPRVHTFDLNAASLVDLCSVPGVTPPLARALLAAGPFDSLAGVATVAGVTPAIAARFQAMNRAMRTLPPGQEGVFSRGMLALLRPYLLRMLALFAIAAAAGGFLYRQVRDARSTRRLAAILNASTASLTVLVLGWGVEGVPAPALLVVPVVLFGLPGAAWRLARTRDARAAARTLAAWVVASAPATLLAWPF